MLRNLWCSWWLSTYAPLRALYTHLSSYRGWKICPGWTICSGWAIISINKTQERCSVAAGDVGSAQLRCASTILRLVMSSPVHQTSRNGKMELLPPTSRPCLISSWAGLEAQNIFSERSGQLDCRVRYDCHAYCRVWSTRASQPICKPPPKLSLQFWDGGRECSWLTLLYCTILSLLTSTMICRWFFWAGPSFLNSDSLLPESANIAPMHSSTGKRSISFQELPLNRNTRNGFGTMVHWDSLMDLPRPTKENQSLQIRPLVPRGQVTRSKASAKLQSAQMPACSVVNLDRCVQVMIILEWSAWCRL